MTAPHHHTQQVHHGHHQHGQVQAFPPHHANHASIAPLMQRDGHHQAQQTLYVTTWVKADGKKIKYDQENTGYGWRTDVTLEPHLAAQPTSCQMKRPAS